ncbi:NIC-domain-containing protein [Nadsonia fulvescens var. elongata DSM 6958]|uniref:Nuclear pore protein n=1 Tax=Nadsonia fulvescens var. elongata DSM 6958 TaxID=857566 RepID=A0A1E3PK61_9ASCO|nr:NIC-domain-containing protein [Nadsonia fulvescens var. elongata DSM 6958]
MATAGPLLTASQVSTESKNSPGDSTLLPPAAALLSELIESSRNLPNSLIDLGAIQLGLNEVKKRASTLRSKYSDSNDTRAHYLLAGSGINAEDISLELQSIEVSQSLEPVTVSFDSNIDTYLRTKKEENILTSIEESISSSAREFDIFLAQNVSLDWKQRKDQICQHFGLISGRQVLKEKNAHQEPAHRSKTHVTSKVWGKSSLGRSVLGPLNGDCEFSDVEIPASATSSSSAQQQSAGFSLPRAKRFASVVTELNDQRAAKRPFPISISFSKVTESFGIDSRTQQLHDSWKILTSITGETSNKPVRERKFASIYSKIESQDPDAIAVSEMITKGSRAFLERQFSSLIENEISKRPKEAQLGGVPSVYNKIRAYVNLKYLRAGQWTKPNLEIVNDIPIWAVLYYMLRSGNAKEALDFTNQAELAFQRVDRSFPVYLKAYVNAPDGRLPRNLLERIHAEFNQSVRFFDEASDPYKYALYKIIGRSDLSRRTIPEILHTAEDWLWAQLILSRESDREIEPLHERYTLADIQRIVLQYGTKHFNPTGNNSGFYFQILLLCGLFEWAVHYLYSYSPIDAVHFAIALSYYGLLRVVPNIENVENDLLVFNSKESPELNFAKMIGYYTRDFRRSDPKEVVDYIILIGINCDLENGVGQKQLQLCHDTLKELVLETREFRVLLGDVRADGSRTIGAIEHRMKLAKLNDSKDFLHTITEQAAIRAGEDGRTADAVLLYHLSEEYDTVVTIINKTLGETLCITGLGSQVSSLPDGIPIQISASADPAQLASNMLTMYSTNPSIISQVSQKNRDTCNVLLKIAKAMDAYARRDWYGCLKDIESTNIIPTDPKSEIGAIRRKAQQFIILHESIARNVPSLLIMTMQCCANLTQQLSDSEYVDLSRSHKTQDLRLKARNCMIYSGMIQYRMSKEVYSQLTSLEIALS